MTPNHHVLSVLGEDPNLAYTPSLGRDLYFGCQQKLSIYPITEELGPVRQKVPSDRNGSAEERQL